MRETNTKQGMENINQDCRLGVVLVMGKSGVGKSTFIHRLGGRECGTGDLPVVSDGTDSGMSVQSFLAVYVFGNLFAGRISHSARHRFLCPIRGLLSRPPGYSGVR